MRPSLKDQIKSYTIACAKSSALAWPIFQKVRGKTSGKFCSSNTDLCVEGFESSANTYTFEVFRHLDKSLNIGHHTHAVAGLKLAMRYEVPTLILFRDPCEAIPSVVTRFRPSVCEATLNYIYFYEYVLQVVDYVILARFDEITENIGSVIRRVDQHTALDFETYDIQDISESARMYIQEWTQQKGRPDSISLPLNRREQAKQEVRERLATWRLFRKAQSVFEQVDHIHLS